MSGLNKQTNKQTGVAEAEGPAKVSAQLDPFVDCV